MTKKLTNSIKEYIDERFNRKLDKLTKEMESALKKADSPSSIDSVKRTFELELAELKKDFEYATWLNNATKKAAQIRIATHTSSYPNSSANGANVISDNLVQLGQYADTSSLSVIELDIAGNAAAFDIGALLLLSDGNKTLLDFVLDGDPSPLEKFSMSDEQAEKWLENLSKSVNSKDLKSHYLSRQVYFPIGDDEYHLLMPLYPLSIAQHLHKTINHSRYSEEMVLARKAKRENKQHDKPVIAFPNLAIIKLGGSKPQNVSSLNAKRGGYNYLLPCTPPVVVTKARQYDGCLFQSYEFKKEVREPLKRLTRALIASSSMEPVVSKVRKLINELIEGIIDTSLHQALTLALQDAGWTNSTRRMPIHQQVWLDRNNPDFSTYDQDWKRMVSTDFSVWLITELNSLSRSALTLGEAEKEIWAKSFLKALEMTE